MLFFFPIAKNNYHLTSIRVFCLLFLFIGNFITSLLLYNGYHKLSSLKWCSLLCPLFSLGHESGCSVQELPRTQSVSRLFSLGKSEGRGRAGIYGCCSSHIVHLAEAF